MTTVQLSTLSLAELLRSLAGRPGPIRVMHGETVVCVILPPREAGEYLRWRSHAAAG